MSAMASLAGRRILTAGGTTYQWEDLVLCGHLWGDWPALRQRAAAGLACLARLDEFEEDDADGLEEQDIEAAAAEFRYARGLVAAQELEAWLDRWGLDTDAWWEWVQRGLLLTRWSADIDAIVEEFAPDPDDVDAIVPCEAICTGLAASLATRLAGRAAIYARMREREPQDTVAAKDIEALVGSVPPAVLEQELPDVAWRPRLDTLARLELAWREFVGTQLTADAVRSIVDAHRLEWIRLSVRTASLPARDLANEIALCVRDDGRDFAATCAEAGQRVTEATWYLDQTDGRLQDALVAARPGELLGPLPVDDTFMLVAVLDKILPAETDPYVRQRAERALLDRLVARDIQDRVTWHETL